MTRQLAFVVILGLVTSQAAAQESRTWSSEADPSRPSAEVLEIAAPVVVADENGAELTVQPVARETSYVLNEGLFHGGAQPDAHASPVSSSLFGGCGHGGCADCNCDCGSCDDCACSCFRTDHPWHGQRTDCYPCDKWLCGESCCDVSVVPGLWSETALRVGGWGVIRQGSRTKTGEFQDLNSSPFWDVDTIRSDGERTWDITMSGLDNEANNTHVRFYSPGLTANVEFQRFLRRWDHDPLTGFDANSPIPPGPDDNVISEDLNVGEDYAIRVQELDARFKGRLTNNLSWRMNVWALRKFGERQANATAHCFNINAPADPGDNGNVCHVLSQRQTVDWTTFEVQPAVEARFEALTVEYSHTLRTFGQDDGGVSHTYSRFDFSPARGVEGPPFDYALVPDNTTNIDRVKVNARLTDFNQLYASGYYGNTENKFRDTNRQFAGFDARLVNTALERTRVTAYANMHDENNELPTSFLTEPPLAPANGYDEASLRHPVDYNRLRAGIRSSWQPYGDPYSCGPSYGLWDGLSLVTGYEYSLMHRSYATYNTALGEFVQPDTKRHQIEFGPQVQWSPTFNTYLRNKVRYYDDPLIGVREASGGFNTNQPEFENQLDIGATWAPAANFMAMVQFSPINRYHDSQYAYFDENNFPFLVSLWHAPTDRLSLSGGYAYFSNFIDQDITLGFTLPDVPTPPLRTETTRWDYDGESHQVSLNANYLLTPNVQLVGGWIWDYGTNVFAVPASPAGADWSALPSIADVRVKTNRLTAGVDWQPFYAMNTYVRYVLFDYEDIGGRIDSGTAHMALLGASLLY